jgi:hypothetical protein
MGLPHGDPRDNQIPKLIGRRSGSFGGTANRRVDRGYSAGCSYLFVTFLSTAKPPRRFSWLASFEVVQPIMGKKVVNGTMITYEAELWNASIMIVMYPQRRDGACAIHSCLSVFPSTIRKVSNPRVRPVISAAITNSLSVSVTPPQ